MARPIMLCYGSERDKSGSQGDKVVFEERSAEGRTMGLAATVPIPVAFR